MNNWQLFVGVVTSVSLSLQTATAANILFLCSVLSPSHSLWCYRYMSLLVERGHQITVLGIDHPKTKTANITTFIADEVYANFSDLNPTADWYIGTDAKLRSMYYAYIPITKKSSQVVLHSNALQELIRHNKHKKKPFDLVVHDNCNADALLGLVPMFGNPPLMLVTTARFPQWMDINAGNPISLAYTPTWISGFGPQMTFYERIVNTVHYLFLEWMYCHLINFQDQLMREVFGAGLPHVRDIVRRANLVIYNHHFALDGSRPMLPGVVGIAGLHITEPQPLPKELDDFMNGAEDGVIIVSFGTNVNSKWLPPSFSTLMINALRPLRQRVLWKWEENLSNLPPHILISQWLPQGDILAHPNVCLFITHCGLLGIQESLHRGVPLLAIPVFFDQRENAAKLVRQNLSVELNVATMTAEQLTETVQEMLTNPKYKQNTGKVSELLRDTPQTAQEQAVFWTEYVIRHKGGPHLHSAAADLPTFQLLMLDMLVSAIVIGCIVIWLMKSLTLRIWRKISTGRLKAKSD